MERELTFRIVLEKPPPGIDFALQKGAGSNYEIVQKQRSHHTDLTFEFSLRVKNNKDSIPGFAGPFAQGKPRERFIYIGVGTFAGQVGTTWSRRLKIPLTGFIPATLQQLLANPSVVLETRVPGTGKDGSPTCGTVKQFQGWKLVKG